jgi:hypothetical protein
VSRDAPRRRRSGEWRSRLKYQSPLSRQNVGEHEWLIQRLRTSNLGSPNSVQILSVDLGDRLHKLKALRTLADYRMGRRWRPGIEDQACDEAAEILRLAV